MHTNIIAYTHIYTNICARFLGDTHLGREKREERREMREHTRVRTEKKEERAKRAAAG